MRQAGKIQVERYGAGRVVAVRERNGYHDSDFYAMVAVDRAEGGYDFRWEMTGSTAWASEMLDAVVDATPEVFEAYRVAREAAIERDMERRARERAAMAEIGSTVVVVEPVTRGANKTEAGAVGTVKAVAAGRQSRYGTWRGPDRIRVEMESGQEIWIDRSRIVVQGFEEYGPGWEVQPWGIGAGWPEVVTV